MVPFWARCTPILVYFSGDWDVRWGYDVDFDPWPNENGPLNGHHCLLKHRLLFACEVEQADGDLRFEPVPNETQAKSLRARDTELELVRRNGQT